MKVNAELNIPAGTTKDELVNALDGIPGDAVISIRTITGGWGNLDSYSLKLTWEVGSGKSVYNKARDGEDEWGGFYR